MISSRDGEAVAVYRTRNIHASRTRYELDPKEQLHVLNEIEDAGLELGAIYHSHPRTEPEPLPTDVNLARWWPEPLYVIVGLGGDEPDVRAWQIVDGVVSEATLEVWDGSPVDT